MDIESETSSQDDLSAPRHQAPPKRPVRQGRRSATHRTAARARNFRASFFPGASHADWNDWQWQLRHRLRDLSALKAIFRLAPQELEAIERIGGRLPVGITPYYASLMDRFDAADPIRRTMIPVGGELIRGPGEADDPLDEDGDSPVPGLVHRYPDRVLFLATNFCATYCRYCTRARLVGHTGEYH
ncbi:MAG TPA: lysine 2,3-aminomutase, partial [Myxococcota bacterium]|nr:lysine 2,3-aminomutase [Myxococcota bacterium]